MYISWKERTQVLLYIIKCQKAISKFSETNIQPTNSTPNYVIVQGNGNRMGVLTHEVIHILNE